MMRNAGVEGNHAALPSPMGDGSGQKKEVDNRKSLAYSIPNSVQTMGVRSQALCGRVPLNSNGSSPYRVGKNERFCTL